MDDLLILGDFDFYKNLENLNCEQLIEDIFRSETSLIKDFPLSKLQRLEIIDAQYEIFERAQIK